MGKKLTLISMYAGLICASCFIRIPLAGGVPITVQDMMCMLSGLILGPFLGAISVLVFLILGSFGLPVFSGGQSGFHVLYAGPTGGFLVGYLLSAFVGGLIIRLFLGKDFSSHKKPLVYTVVSIASLVATVVVFGCGIYGFHRIVVNKTWAQVMATVLIPFIPGNIIKLFVMVPLSIKFNRSVNNYLMS